MARGPLPSEKKRRRNNDTIPTTELPASGRKGRPPAVPSGYNLRKVGANWWKWAWGTPQAAAWDKGALYVIARRASLEDDLADLDHAIEVKELTEMFGCDENKQIRELEFLIGRLGATAGGRNAVMREMRELDKVLGLTPKGLADLRWRIVEAEGPPAPTTRRAKSRGDRKARLSIVPAT